MNKNIKCPICNDFLKYKEASYTSYGYDKCYHCPIDEIEFSLYFRDDILFNWQINFIYNIDFLSKEELDKFIIPNNYPSLFKREAFFINSYKNLIREESAIYCKNFEFQFQGPQGSQGRSYPQHSFVQGHQNFGIQGPQGHQGPTGVRGCQAPPLGYISFLMKEIIKVNKYYDLDLNKDLNPQINHIYDKLIKMMAFK